MNRRLCQNFNHRRNDAPVRYCPNCGEVVNGQIALKRCSRAVHEMKRMQQSRFCVDCGQQLIQ